MDHNENRKCFKFYNYITVYKVIFMHIIQNNKCEKLIKDGKSLEAIEAANKLKNDYDKAFCMGKAYYRENNFTQALQSFKNSEKHG